MTDASAAIESRSLAIGKWANLFMAAAGVAAASLSRSDALLVDGLYSGVNFLSAIVAAKVGAAVTRPTGSLSAVRLRGGGVPLRLLPVAVSPRNHRLRGVRSGGQDRRLRDRRCGP